MSSLSNTLGPTSVKLMVSIVEHLSHDLLYVEFLMYNKIFNRFDNCYHLSISTY